MTSSTSAPGLDALGDLAHGVLDAVQLVPAPRVGLVEVELHAVEVLRVHRVALAPDRVVLVGVWRVLLHEEPPQRRRTPRWRGSPGARGGRGSARSPSPDASYSSTRVRKNGRVEGSSPPHVSACFVHATAWRRAATMPSAAPSASAASMLESPWGTSARRSATTCQSSAVSRAMRSKAMRTVCTGLPSTRRSRRRSPASYSTRPSSSRSRMTSAAIRSASSPTSTVSRARRVARSCSARSAAPSGE